MARIEESIEIAAAPADVFKFCHDPARRHEWDDRVTRVEMLSTPPVRSGTLLRIDAGAHGEFSFTWDAEYVEFQFPVGSTVRVVDAAPSSPFQSGSEKWQFTSTGSPGAGAGVRLTVVWDYQPRGFIGRLTDALAQRSANRRAIRRSLANLKTLLEGKK